MGGVLLAASDDSSIRVVLDRFFWGQGFYARWVASFLRTRLWRERKRPVWKRDDEVFLAVSIGSWTTFSRELMTTDPSLGWVV